MNIKHTMKIKILPIVLITLLFSNCKTDKNKVEPINNETAVEQNNKPSSDIENSNFYEASNIKITPIEHASLVLEYNNTSIYIDPVGDAERYTPFSSPNFILITDIHGDHLDTKTLEAINTTNTIIIGPEAVKEKLPESLKAKFNVFFNGLNESFLIGEFTMGVEAIPMYNLREEALKFHTKGRGNGYILTLNNQRIYISGDTEDIPEMRNLDNIDIALVCMNLPYTMPVENAADAVLAFQPKIVLPYHYRGTEGLSDVANFKTIMNNKNMAIEVVQLNWYK